MVAAFMLRIATLIAEFTPFFCHAISYANILRYFAAFFDATLMPRRFRHTLSLRCELPMFISFRLFTPC